MLERAFFRLATTLAGAFMQHSVLQLGEARQNRADEAKQGAQPYVGGCRKTGAPGHNASTERQNIVQIVGQTLSSPDSEISVDVGSLGKSAS